jgi:hypothetical protein
MRVIYCNLKNGGMKEDNFIFLYKIDCFISPPFCRFGGLNCCYCCYLNDAGKHDSNDKFIIFFCNFVANHIDVCGTTFSLFKIFHTKRKK